MALLGEIYICCHQARSRPECFHTYIPVEVGLGGLTSIPSCLGGRFISSSPFSHIILSASLSVHIASHGFCPASNIIRQARAPSNSRPHHLIRSISPYHQSSLIGTKSQNLLQRCRLRSPPYKPVPHQCSDRAMDHSTH